MKPQQFVKPSSKAFFLSSSQVRSSTQISSLGAQFGDIKRQIKGALLSKFSQSYVLLWVSGSLLVSVVGRWANCCLVDSEENDDSDKFGFKQHVDHKENGLCSTQPGVAKLVVG